MSIKTGNGFQKKEVAQVLNNIEAERIRNHMTKKKLAETLGICLVTYSRWIKEEANIDSEMLIRLSELFNVSIDYLLEGSRHAQER